MTTSAHTIAKFIVQKSESQISNLKLQKLLYYVQGWHLGLKGEPVFTEEIQAWIHGPVVPEIFQTYREYKWTPIARPTKAVTLNDAIADHVHQVLDAYGKLSAAQLEALSHSEEPWIHARNGLAPKAPSKAVITHTSMKQYFGKLANG